MKAFILVIGFLIILSGCRNSTDLPLFGTETSIQGILLQNIAVEFADPNIEQAIRDLLEKPEGKITKFELLKITVLGDSEGNGGAFGDIKGEITTLSDMRWLKNLTTLSLGDCEIRSLVGIEELENLEILRLRRNNISDLEPLCNLVKLKELDLSENPINDISALYNLVNIESLGLGDCQNIDLSPISGMGNLKRLYASYSGITDISMLADKTELEYLQLFHNRISDISALKNLTKLTYLDLSSNNILDIDVLNGLSNLETISIDDNLISEERLDEFYKPKDEDFFTREYRQQLGDDMPEYIIELLAFRSKHSREYQTTKITIKDAETEMLIQEIIPSEYTYFEDNPCSYSGDTLGFYIEDMNFDGYADIRIMEFLPAGPNIPYVCWVWDKNTGQYVYHTELSMITSLEVDYKNELIYSFGRTSASEHFEDYYRYINGTLTLVKKVCTGFLDESDPEQGYSITHELINEQWIMTEKVKIEMGS
ncbi:leucine-rich repeat domain-containing protein [Anaerosporobacter sp.]|uniref:leucine-rich repeat domain-containing protein n=1 Tax=Anaerosporobacter sp. TaxID=1872529 RepID=UPI00286F9B37|nr:leucine-rich repeat domain-containing protein [Anaerosporobacter sp.]